MKVSCADIWILLIKSNVYCPAGFKGARLIQQQDDCDWNAWMSVSLLNGLLGFNPETLKYWVGV